MSALGAIQDKNAHLETSLSAETRLKLDLFSALGEAKRQIEIQQGEIEMLTV
jgi:Macoilin family